MRLLILALSLGLAAGSLGCNDDENLKPYPAPEFPEGQGQLPNGAEPYAPGPYRTTEGSTIKNFKFTGFPNEQADKGAGGLKPIQLADFYNPHADDATYEPASPEKDDRRYPKGSPYGEGKPKPRVLLINVSAVWCGPCNEEAKNVLPGRHAQYKPRGGEFLLQLADGPQPGSAADENNLLGWTSKYKVDYPATIDPGAQLAGIVPPAQYPGNLIVDTKTMRIVKIVPGAPPQSFWDELETLLAP